MEPIEFLKLLWKRESEEPNAMFIDIFGETGFDEIDEDSGMKKTELIAKLKSRAFQTKPKSSKTAKMYRKDGRASYQNGDWFGAMNLYSQGLCFAEIGSAEAGRAYFYRSLCFSKLKMYEKSLVDVFLAKKTNCPSKKIKKLEKYRAEWLKEMEKTEPIYDLVPKLDFDADKNFPGMASVLQIKYDKFNGRHVTAKCDIEAGKTVLLEEPYLQIMRSPGFRNCTTCLKTSMNFVPCSRCTSAMFCNNNKCPKKNILHEMECEDADLNANMDIQYSARSIFLALDAIPDVDELMAFVKDAMSSDMKEVPVALVDKRSKYRAFLKLDIFMPSLSDNRFYLRSAYKFYLNLIQRRIIKEKFNTVDKQRFLMHLTLYHYCLLTCSSNKRTRDQCVHLTKSFFNHSCVPNILLTECANLTVGTTVFPIKKGQQLFVSYFQGEDDHIDDRQRHIAMVLNFCCKCQRCEPRNWPIVINILHNDPVYIRDVFSQFVPSLFDDKRKMLRLKNECIKYLNKYAGYGWNDELNNLIKGFEALLMNLYMTVA